MALGLNKSLWVEHLGLLNVIHLLGLDCSHNSCFIC